MQICDEPYTWFPPFKSHPQRGQLFRVKVRGLSPQPTNVENKRDPGVSLLVLDVAVSDSGKHWRTGDCPSSNEVDLRRGCEEVERRVEGYCSRKR